MATLTGTAWDTVPIRGKFMTNELVPVPVEGTVTAYIDRKVTDRTTGVILLPTRAFKIWTLVGGALPADAALPATDDPDIYPQNFNIRLEVTPTNAEGDVLYVRPKLADAANGIDLATILTQTVVGDSVPTMRDVVGGFATWSGNRSLTAPDGTSLSLASWANSTSLYMPDGSTVVVPKNLSQIASPTSTYNFGGQLLSNLASPVNTTDAATKAYVDSRAMGTGNADMAGYRITNLGAPTAANDAATKNYVDTAVTVAANWSSWTTFTPTFVTAQMDGYYNYSADVSGAGGILGCAYRTRADEVQVNLAWKATTATTGRSNYTSVVIDGLPSAITPRILISTLIGTTYSTDRIAHSTFLVGMAQNTTATSPTAGSWTPVYLENNSNFTPTPGGTPTAYTYFASPSGRFGLTTYSGFPTNGGTVGGVSYGQAFFHYRLP